MEDGGSSRYPRRGAPVRHGDGKVAHRSNDDANDQKEEQNSRSSRRQVRETQKGAGSESDSGSGESSSRERATITRASLRKRRGTRAVSRIRERDAYHAHTERRLLRRSNRCASSTMSTQPRAFDHEKRQDKDTGGGRGGLASRKAGTDSDGSDQDQDESEDEESDQMEEEDDAQHCSGDTRRGNRRSSRRVSQRHRESNNARDFHGRRDEKKQDHAASGIGADKGDFRRFSSRRTSRRTGRAPTVFSPTWNSAEKGYDGDTVAAKVTGWINSGRASLYCTADGDRPHVWLNQRVRRIFPGTGVYDGTIVGWLPEDNDDSDSDNIGDLWHMVHDDGDEEDLEKHEVEEGLKLYKSNLQWQTDHAHVHKRVRRIFLGDDEGNEPSVADGTIIGWLPEEADGPALWHMVHDDGDEEDLEKSEVEAAMALWNTHVKGGWETKHRYVGKAVRRFFDRGGGTGELCDGVIVGWLRAGARDEPALWHVCHEDDDEEDLEKFEVDAALAAFDRRCDLRSTQEMQERAQRGAGGGHYAFQAQSPRGERASTRHRRGTDRLNVEEFSSRTYSAEGVKAERKRAAQREREAERRHRIDKLRGSSRRERRSRRSRRRRRSHHHRTRHRKRHRYSDDSSDDDSSTDGFSYSSSDDSDAHHRSHRRRHERDISEIRPLGNSGPPRAIGEETLSGSRMRADVGPVEIDTSVTWDSVGGLQNHVTALKEMVLLPLLYPEVLQRFGVTQPRGVLFYGPPGTGKTLVARALAAACCGAVSSDAYADSATAGDAIFKGKGKDDSNSGKAESPPRPARQRRAPPQINVGDFSSTSYATGISTLEAAAAASAFAPAAISATASASKTASSAKAGGNKDADTAVAKPQMRTQYQRVSFFMRKGADCLSKWVGEAERQLRLLFEQARRHQPSVIFFDEIDGLAPVRSARQDQIHSSIVSTLLALMDGLDDRGQVLVIGATNRIDAVDPALRRPGRFDRELPFGLPSEADRREILGIHTRGWEPPVCEAFKSEVASLTQGYCGADIKALCTEAAMHAVRRQLPQLYQSNVKLDCTPLLPDLRVSRLDFARAMRMITPSSQRHTMAVGKSLPSRLRPALDPELAVALERVSKQFGCVSQWLVPTSRNASSMIGEESEDDDENGVAAVYGNAVDGSGTISGGKHVTLQSLLGKASAPANASRLWSLRENALHRPRLLIAGDQRNGQLEVAHALIADTMLERCTCFHVGLPALVQDPGSYTPEAALVDRFADARRSTPSIIFWPDVDLWWHAASEILRHTMQMLIDDLPASLPVLLLTTATVSSPAELPSGLRAVLGFVSHDDPRVVTMPRPTDVVRRELFRFVGDEVIHLATPPSAAEVAARKRRRKARKKPLPVLNFAAPPTMPPSASSAQMATQAAVAAQEPAQLTSRELEKEEHLLRELRIWFETCMDWCSREKRYAPFFKPVDEEDAPDYRNIVANPITLSEIWERSSEGHYLSMESWMQDVLRVRDNCHEYNPATTTRGLQLRHAATAMVENIKSMAYRFNRELDYDLFAKCRRIEARRHGGTASQHVSPSDVASVTASPAVLQSPVAKATADGFAAANTAAATRTVASDRCSRASKRQRLDLDQSSASANFNVAHDGQSDVDQQGGGIEDQNEDGQSGNESEDAESESFIQYPVVEQQAAWRLRDSFVSQTAGLDLKHIEAVIVEAQRVLQHYAAARDRRQLVDELSSVAARCNDTDA